MDPIMEHLLEFVNDQKHFTARGLKQLQVQTGMEPPVLAAGIGGIVALYLLAGQHAQFVANAILTIVPLLVTFVFVKERPLTSHILIYWSCYGLLTLFDNVLQEMPCYYVLKVGLLALLFLRPFVYIDKILTMIKNTDEGADHALFTADELRQLEDQQRGKRSPPPEKPEGERPQNSLRQSASSRKMQPVVHSASTPATALSSRRGDPRSTRTALLADQPRSTRTAIPTSDQPPSTRTAIPLSDQPPSTRTAIPLAADRPPSIRAPVAEPPPVSPNTSDTQLTQQSISDTSVPTARSFDSNTMLKNPEAYQLSADSPMAYSPVSHGAANLNDMIFEPTNKIVFNAPFDDRTLTYHMTVMNNSTKYIAFAIKSNAIPRITATPPHGVLRPKQKQIISIHLDKFNWGEVNTERDRIAYDYAFCAPETKQFSHKLFQSADTRRRKNIAIEYNP